MVARRASEKDSALGVKGETDGGRSARGAGWKNSRSRGTALRHGSHASTPITRDSLTIGLPLAVTEIYRKAVRRGVELGRFAIPRSALTREGRVAR